jgi:hypothetical protein
VLQFEIQVEQTIEQTEQVNCTDRLDFSIIGSKITKHLAFLTHF